MPSFGWFLIFDSPKIVVESHKCPMCFNFLTRFFLQVRIENPNQPTSVFETVFKALAYIFLLFEILFLPLVKHHIDHPHCTRDKNAGSTIQRFRGGLGLCFGLALKQS